MATRINLNADMGEGFGAYDIGDDAALLKIVRSANVACGFHAGDPLTMRRVVAEARRQEVSVGAHPGFNDLWGFGRRPIRMNADELEYLVAYQIGALQALCAYEGVTVTHMKPHGALYNMAAADEAYALAMGRAVRTIDRNMIYVALAGSEMATAAQNLGLRVALEGFCDRAYEDDGSLTPRGVAGAMLTDPEIAAAQAVGLATDGEIVARSGKRISRRIDTLCIHGDAPASVATGARVRQALEAAGVEIVTLPELALN